VNRFSRALLCAALLLLPGRPATAAGDGVAISDSTALYGDIANAHTIEITAFTLQSNGPLVRALTSACRRRAHVDVELDYPDFPEVRATNDEAIRTLKSAGCNARPVDHPLHMKVAVLDNAIYLSDRNFADGGLFVRDTRADDRGVALQALNGVAGATDHFWTRKSDAIQAEAQLMHSAAGTLFVESESFGPGTAVFDTLIERRRAGVAVYLLVATSEFRSDARERAAVAQLIASGVTVRLSDQDAKLAVPDQIGAWVGSSNATSGLPDQIDYGMYLGGSTYAQEITRRFSADWARSVPVYGLSMSDGGPNL
jgi:phosphatidylserine/phosphatidylglycerophosphate/cardiolipin synthase-like enzyme